MRLGISRAWFVCGRGGRLGFFVSLCRANIANAEIAENLAWHRGGGFPLLLGVLRFQKLRGIEGWVALLLAQMDRLNVVEA